MKSIFDREKLQPGEYTSISNWLLGRTSANPFHSNARPTISLEAGGFVAIDRVVPVHLAGSVAAQSLEESWHAVRQYVEEACELVHSPDECPLLDNEEIDMILTQIGRPPPPCYPIYFIAARDRTTGTEQLLYIGKTSSRKSRFSGGHAALTKLHDPIYDGTDKQLYFATVMLLGTDGEYLPLEAVQPLEEASKMLLSVEAQLIHWFSPAFNRQGLAKDNSTAPLSVIHIQNMISPFLRDEMVYGRPK